MKIMLVQKLMLFLSCCTALIFKGYADTSVSYDYSASTECLTEPLRAQYGGGIIENAEFGDGLKAWSAFGYGMIAERRSESGNRFVVAYNKSLPYQSPSQKVYLHKENLYTFSAWVQLGKGADIISVIFKTPGGFIHAAIVEAKSGCWSMLKGGLTVTTSGPAEFYFESKNTTADVWVDSISLQPFTEDQWRAHQAESISKVRKKTFKLQALDATGDVLPGALVSIKHKRPGFPFGCAIASTILNNTAYQKWFASRFTVTTFENEMKWYANEYIKGKEDYSDADAMLSFAKSHRIGVRGHNIFWDALDAQPGWVKSLNASQLRIAANRRIRSIMSRYRGKLIAWDVVNENIHSNYFETMLGPQASANFYKMAQQLDPRTTMFLNEFNTLAWQGEVQASPHKYLEKVKQIMASSRKRLQLGIGLEGHFGVPNIPYMRSALDFLAQAKLPIWLTEVDVSRQQNQAQYLEPILREAYAHPAVKGIVMWGAWHPQGCYQMCLTDNNFKNLPTGDVVDKLIGEWKSDHVVGTTDTDGSFSMPIFHGEYQVSISHPTRNSSWARTLTVDDGSQHDEIILKVEI